MLLVILNLFTVLISRSCFHFTKRVTQLLYIILSSQAGEDAAKTIANRDRRVRGGLKVVYKGVGQLAYVELRL